MRANRSACGASRHRLRPPASVLGSVDVAVRVLDGAKSLSGRRGSLLFAHFGLSGPVAMDVSRAISGHPEPTRLALEIDFLPDPD